MGEVPWPTGVQPCCVELNNSGTGWLTFINPKTGRNESLPITTDPAAPRPSGPAGSEDRWCWHDNGDGTGWTEPSIHSPSEFHSPYRTLWRITPTETNGEWPLRDPEVEQRE